MLRTRVYGGEWRSTPTKLVARRTYETMLGPFAGEERLAEYQATAGRLATRTYAVTLV